MHLLMDCLEFNGFNDFESNNIVAWGSEHEHESSYENSSVAINDENYYVNNGKIVSSNPGSRGRANRSRRGRASAPACRARGSWPSRP